jgi:hypothetical protein
MLPNTRIVSGSDGLQAAASKETGLRVLKYSTAFLLIDQNEL